MKLFARARRSIGAILSGAGSLGGGGGFTGSLLYSLGRTLVGANTTGVHVDERTALSFPAAFAAVNTVSTDLASLPLRLVQVMADGVERQAFEHRAYNLFTRSPDNGATTPMRFRQALMGHALTYGSGFAEIVESTDKSLLYLYLLNPATTLPYLDEDGSLRYRLNGISGIGSADKAKIIHLAGLSYDGLCGYGVVQIARQAFGLGLAGERLGGSYIGNGAFNSGLLKSPQNLDPSAYKELVESFSSGKTGSDNAGKVGVLPPGFDFVAVPSDAAKAQLMELRAFQVLEMARLFRLPPHKLGDYSKASYASIEAANLEYVQTTLLPWAVALEQTLNLRLLSPSEQADGYTYKHDFGEFLRADASGRAALYKIMFSSAAITPNEIRSREGYQPLGEATANQTYVPLNIQGGDASPDTQKDPA